MSVTLKLTNSDAQLCVELMREGLRECLRGPNPDIAVNAYKRIVEAFKAAEVSEEKKPSTETVSKM